MSKSAKKRALRLFLYLRSVGHTPNIRAANYYELAAILSKEYDELPPDIRKSSRLLGRKLIRAAGLVAAYQSAPVVAPFNPVMIPRAKCSICRVKKLNKPKSVWPTKEDAEHSVVTSDSSLRTPVRRATDGMSLSVNADECPIKPRPFAPTSRAQGRACHDS